VRVPAGGVPLTAPACAAFTGQVENALVKIKAVDDISAQIGSGTQGSVAAFKEIGGTIARISQIARPRTGRPPDSVRIPLWLYFRTVAYDLDVRSKLGRRAVELRFSALAATLGRLIP
jgi:hypothetical protein